MLEMIYHNDLNLSNFGGCILDKVVGGGGGASKPPKIGSRKPKNYKG